MYVFVFSGIQIRRDGSGSTMPRPQVSNSHIALLRCRLFGVLQRLRDEELAKGLGAELGHLVRRVGDGAGQDQRVQPGWRGQRL